MSHTSEKRPQIQQGPFVCYSRKGKLFVQRLFEALVARGRDAWTDWDDIPPTAEWMKEIYAGIDAAPAVIVVLSPDSLSSTVCGQELSYAIRQNKRLIPIECREVVAAEVSEPIRRLNRIQITGKTAMEDRSFGDRPVPETTKLLLSTLWSTELA